MHGVPPLPKHQHGTLLAIPNPLAKAKRTNRPGENAHPNPKTTASPTSNILLSKRRRKPWVFLSLRLVKSTPTGRMSNLSRRKKLRLTLSERCRAPLHFPTIYLHLLQSKSSAPKTRAQSSAKESVEVNFAPPPRDTTRGGRGGDRGGRGGGRGRGGDRGDRGGARGRGASRGGARSSGSASQKAFNLDDQSAFPALG